MEQVAVVNALQKCRKRRFTRAAQPVDCNRHRGFFRRQLIDRDECRQKIRIRFFHHAVCRVIRTAVRFAVVHGRAARRAVRFQKRRVFGFVEQIGVFKLVQK